MTVQTAFWIGVSVGLVVALIIGLFTDRASGVLKIDHSNPRKDRYLFVFNDDVDLSTKRRVIVKVDNNADLSQN